MREPSERTTVAIVGYGPVGGALANLLARQGVDVAIIEQYKKMYPLPRAGGLVPESLRLFQALGLAERLFPGMVEWTFWWDVFDKDWNKVLERKPDLGQSLQGWPHNIMFLQPKFEAALRQENERLGIVAHLGYRVSAIAEEGDGFELMLSPVDGDGKPRRLRADWVIGCDGDHSTVREVIGGGQEDFGRDDAYLIIHLRVIREGVKLPDRIFEWANPDRAVTYVTPFPDNLRIFEFRVLPGETKEELTAPDKIWELLSPWLKPGDAELVRAVVWHFHSRVANRWRRGRLLIAGDAAHVMTPSLGEGLNSGFRDVMNLGWKLGAVINGTLEEAVLDTYQQERRPHVRVLVQMSNALKNAVLAIADNPDTYSANLAIDRVFAAPRPPINYGMHGEAPPPVGTISDQPRLASGVLLDDFVGYHFAVVADETLLAAANIDADPVWRALGAVKIPASDPAVRAWLDRLDVAAIVVRPDRYIFGVADSVEELAGIRAILEKYLTKDARASSLTMS